MDRRQMELDGAMGAQSQPRESESIRLDYRERPLGDFVGGRQVVVKCGRCGKGSIRRGTYREESWVHVEEIFLSGVDKSRRRTLSRCREFEQSRAEAREKKAEQLRMRNS